MIAPFLLFFAGWDTDDYQRGLELARAGQWDAARQVFAAGWAKSPSDKRFPLELAGIAYRKGNRASAKRFLHQALRLDRRDRYGNDFLATLYFLDQNTEAALKFWNRIGKPSLVAVSIDPPLPTHAPLLDRAMAFSPAALLKLGDYRTTLARFDALRFFTAYNLELQAKPQEQFDAILHWTNPSPWLRIAAAAAGLPYQTLYADFQDVAGSGGNWSNLLRWDAQKRRILSSFAAPLRGDPKWRYNLHADARSETWNLGTPADFRMTRIEAGASLRAITSGRFSWTMALIAASRHFRAAPQFTAGFSAKYRAAAALRLLDLPEHRFTLDSAATWDLARLFSAQGGLYSQGQAKLAARWLPRPRGRDYEINTQARAGKTIGQAPFDELFLLGVERDNELWLRSHAGTRAGKKGSAPIAASYFLSNTEFDKQLFEYTLLRVSAGPFLDLARIQDFHNRFSRSWFAGAGLQAKVALTGAMTLTISYGRDLRGAGRAFYASVGASR